MDNLDNLKIDFGNWYYEQEQEYATGKIHPDKIWEWFNKSFPHERVVNAILAGGKMNHVIDFSKDKYDELEDQDKIPSFGDHYYLICQETYLKGEQTL